MAAFLVLRRAGAALAWLCSILLALTFARAGIDKLSSHGGFARMFAHWGYPAWLRVGIGVAEIAAAALVLWPRLARWGAGGPDPERGTAPDHTRYRGLATPMEARATRWPRVSGVEVQWAAC